MSPTAAPRAPRLADLHPVELLLLCGLAAVLAVADLLSALAALRRSAKPAPRATQPLAAPAVNRLGSAAADLARLPVHQLRTIARQSGYKRLARSGRRVDLLAALAAA